MRRMLKSSKGWLTGSSSTGSERVLETQAVIDTDIANEAKPYRWIRRRS
jgi:hypothetical protein